MAWKLILSFGICLAGVLLLMPVFIRRMKSIGFNQTVSEYSLQEYQEKADTPIMGGVLFILFPVLTTVLLSGREEMNMETFTVLFTFVGYGLIGFIDDYLIAVKKTNDGLTPGQKFLLQVVLAGVVFTVYHSYAEGDVLFPFTRHVWHLRSAYLLLILLMFAGSSNAVNITDGMDGLSAGCVVFSLIPFLIFAVFLHKLSTAVFVAGLIGALLGYLYYNHEPARVFMGDTGALALGAVLAALAMVMKMEINLVFIGGVYVIETLCVMIQITSVKLFHKRVFLYTPIHYAFVKMGYPKKKIVHGFYLASLAFAILGTWIGFTYFL